MNDEDLEPARSPREAELPSRADGTVEPERTEGYVALPGHLGPSTTAPRPWLDPEGRADVMPAAAGAGEGGSAGGRGGRRRWRRSLFAPLLAVALLSAGLSSGGTYLLATAAARTAGSSGAATLVSAGTTASSGDTVVAVSATANPSVVTITVTADQSVGFGGTQSVTGVGSGIIFNANGWILTNKHVVSGATSLTVQLADGRTLSGTVYGVSSTNDLAIVKVNATGLTAASIGNSDSLVVGQTVIAIGSPLGEFTNSVTSGIVSGLDRSIDVEGEHLSSLIQTDTPINPGNSGGPLLNAAGQVVGINTASSSTAQGISFAIPIDAATAMMSAALAGQSIS